MPRQFFAAGELDAVLTHHWRGRIGKWGAGPEWAGALWERLANFGPAYPNYKEGIKFPLRKVKKPAVMW